MIKCKSVARLGQCGDLADHASVFSLEQVKTAGGQTGVNKAMEMPGMYGGSFADLDGHIFELVHTMERC